MMKSTLDNSRRMERVQDVYLFIFFLISCGLSVYFSSRGWWNKIVDLHGFRQTQTAISTYYLIKEGFTINYITPVFGAPWSVPMEFPTYQLMVAALVRITDMPLDQAGRAVSLAFHYFCLVPLYLLLRYLNLTKMHIAVALAFFLASPLYAFWSRTFMIESTALFFSLMCFLFLLNAIKGPSVLNVTGGVLFGIMAALTKITTFSIFCVALFIIIVAAWFSKGRERFALSITGRHLLYGILFLGIPFIAGLMWASHADSLKALNPLGNFNMSSKMNSWHFGTLEMRADPRIWRIIFGDQAPSILGSNWLFLLLPVTFLRKKFRTPAIICLVSFAVAILVYTNLYYRHEYYLYANAIFLVVLMGLSVISLLEKPRLRIIGFIMIPLVLVLMYSRYEAYYSPFLEEAAETDTRLYQTIKTLTEEDDVMLIYGVGYFPDIPYYSERKAIMPNGIVMPDDPRMKKAIENTGRERITAMIICQMNEDVSSFARNVTESLGFMRRPLLVSACGIYLKERRNESSSL